MGLLDAIAQFFGGGDKPVPPRTDFPGDDDLAMARRYDTTYGTDMGAYAQPGNGQRVRTMGLTAANEAMRGDPNAGGRPVMDQAQSDQLLRAWIAAQRSPVAALGFDPRKIALAPEGTPQAGLAGFYHPRNDIMWSEATSPTTPVHESMHRGMEQLRTALGGIAAAPTERPPGMLEAPTADLVNRPIMKLPDGSIATVNTITRSFNEGPRENPKTAKHMLVPTVVSGVQYSDDEATDYAFRKGKHAGVFRTAKEADDYAKALSEAQGRFYTEGGGRPDNPARQANLLPFSEEEIVRALMAKHFPGAEKKEQDAFAKAFERNKKTEGQRQAEGGEFDAKNSNMFARRAAALDALAQREIARRRPMGPR